MLDSVMYPSHEEIDETLAANGCVEGIDLSLLDFASLARDDEYGFERCVVRDVHIKSDALRGSVWRDCQFLNCTFKGCDVREAVFENCHFFNAETAEGSTFRFCELEGTRFVSCDLSVGGLFGCHAFDVEFSDCKMVGFQIEKSNFSRDFGKLKRNVATFNACSLMDANFKEADLSSCVIKDCDLSDADLSSAILVGAEITACNLYGVDFKDCDLSGTDLRGSRLDGFDLTAVRSYQGMQVSAGQQHLLLTSIGIDVFAD